MKSFILKNRLDEEEKNSPERNIFVVDCYCCMQSGSDLNVLVFDFGHLCSSRRLALSFFRDDIHQIVFVAFVPMELYSVWQQLFPLRELEL